MGRSPNDDRSDRYNPTSGAYWAAEANEARQRGDDDDDSGIQPGTSNGCLSWQREVGFVSGTEGLSRNPLLNVKRVVARYVNGRLEIPSDVSIQKLFPGYVLVRRTRTIGSATLNCFAKALGRSITSEEFCEAMNSACSVDRSKRSDAADAARILAYLKNCDKPQ